MTAPLKARATNYSIKDGRRPHPHKPPALHVEAAECEGLPVGPHELTNDAGARTYCRWCGETWTSLDRALRSAS